MKQSDFPEWAQRVKEQYKGTQLRKIGSNIYLYAVSSRRVRGKSYPVLTQSYMGIVTPSGLIEPQSFQFRPLESDAVLFAALPGISEIAFTSDEWESVRQICMIRSGDTWFYPKLTKREEEILRRRNLISPIGSFSR